MLYGYYFAKSFEWHSLLLLFVGETDLVDVIFTEFPIPKLGCEGGVS